MQSLNQNKNGCSCMHELYFCTMKYLSLFVLSFLISCRNSPFKKYLKEADAVTVHFYSTGHPDSLIKIMHTTNRDAIEKLSSFIDNKEITNHECAREGEIIFLKGSHEMQKVEFSMMQSNCRQFTFQYN